MKKYTFATAINCMDGRTQKPIIEYIKKRFKVDYVDMITEPGPDKILSQNTNRSLIASLKRRVLISVKKHISRVIAIVGHYDCAGNPVDINKHLKQIKKSVKTVDRWKLGVSILGLWVNSKFQVKEVILNK